MPDSHSPDGDRQLREQIHQLRIQLERERAEHNRLRQLVDICPEVMYAVDMDGRVLFANRTLEQVYDRPPGALIGRTLREFDADPEQAARYVEYIRGAIRGGRPVRSTDTFQGPDGSVRTFEFQDLPYRDIETGEERLMGVASDVTQRLRLEADRAERQRLERDLDIARQIQRSLLPESAPELPAFEIAGWSRAADHTGGDYYDWMPLPDGRLLITIADVSGHGIGPALVTAFTRAYARAVMRESAPLEALVGKLNNLLCEDLPDDRFVTFAAGVLDPEDRRLEFVSAGHGPSVHHHEKAGITSLWGANGVPLAVIEDAPYDRPVSIEFEPGDTLLLISDGFFEAQNSDGAQFGTDRLRDTVSRHASQGAAPLINALCDEVALHSSGVEQSDDMTAVALRCRA